MKPNLLKIIVIALGLLISPMVIAALLAGIYILILLISGQNFKEGCESLLLVIDMIRPYIHYLTVIPMLMVLFAKVLIPQFKKKA